MTKLFISHSSQDDPFVLEVQQALTDLKEDVWIDSRELRGGDPLETAIQKGIEDASAFAVLVSTHAFQSKWVGKELRLALAVQKQRGGDNFRVFALSLDGTKLGLLENEFDEEPIFISVSSAAGGAEAAVHSILVAMGKRKAHDPVATPQPKAEPLEELVLELSDFRFHEQDGVRRPSAHARLTYEPATPGLSHIRSTQSWRFIAPIGPIEAEELRWYLEKFAIWPSDYFRDRARKVEDDLRKWGELLHAAAMPDAHTANVMKAWKRIDGQVQRRFSVHIDAAPEAGTAAADVETSREAATLVLGLPWELLHDGMGFLFQGAKPTRVRRRLPNTRDDLKIPVVATPIRVLLVTARPEDDACGYIDHRASALPLVEAMEELGGLVRIHVLSPPTLAALRDELDRAQRAESPYHVVHFDGHGVFDRRAGLGGLCFEDPQDIGKLDHRRHVTIYTSELGPLLRDHRIPLVFLEACQTATAEKASESVATELLKVGVASVVAMSHSVLVETARRFVESFYHALAEGKRVGDAMLAGQRQLKDDTFRGKIFSAGELRLEDWFVPVLFQEKDDPQLFRSTPSRQTREDFRTALSNRLGELPDIPSTGFIGRSRELLALQRLIFPPSPHARREGPGIFLPSPRAREEGPGIFLPSPRAREEGPGIFLPSPRARGEGPGVRGARFAVIRGQGGEGKTTLAAEFARWMVRSHHVRRAAFVSVEMHDNARAVLDAIGRQIVGREFSASGDLAEVIQQVERALREQSTLLVVDNMESILEPPYDVQVLSEDMHRELKGILALCDRLLKVGDTRFIFTSREALPAPFDAVRQRRELHQLDREDAVKLVERALNAETSCATGSASAAFNSAGSPFGTGRASGTQDHGNAAMDAQREEIEQLVDAVHCHARTLALLAPALRSRGVEATRKSLVELMAEMERRFPGNREQSVFASVELSLQRMSAANQDRARVLGAFHGGVNLDVLRVMMQWEKADVASLAGELIETGLATPNRYKHLTLNPALCPYLRGQFSGRSRGPSGTFETNEPGHSDPAQLAGPTLDELTTRWVEAMRQYAGFLMQQRSQNAEVAATLTMLELPNLFALLDLVQHAGDAEATIDLATSLYSLLQNIGKPRLLERVGQVRDVAAAALGDVWNHARFEATRTCIEQQLRGGQVREALEGAQQLLQRARATGEQAYPDADYDLAMAGWLLARVLNRAGGSEQALPLLDEARQRFEAVAKERPGRGAERMASVCLSEQGACLLNLGRLDEATAAYEEGIRRDERRGATRDVAVGKGQLGTVHMQQRRYPEALAAYAEARERFTQLDEPGSVAVIWHQTGMVYQVAGQPEAAEDAYRKSLAIEVRQGNVAGQARTLSQLGSLYFAAPNHGEEAASFFRQAADKYAQIRDASHEGMARSNLSEALRKLLRLDEARQEIFRAIECKAQFGHSSEPWKTWAILADIETDTGNPAAAAEAKGKAIACYLAYRRDGGENHDGPGRICLAVTQSLRTGDPDEAASLLKQQLPRFEAAGFGGFIRALQAIVTGSRDRTLADPPDLDYSMAAEILFLIETLEQRP